MSDGKQEIYDILRKAYQIEVDGYTFYSMVADRADKPAVQELFEKLARDEVEHKAYLTGVMRSYDEKGTSAFKVERRAPDLRGFSAAIFDDRLKARAEGAQFELGVLSIGMQLESNAVRYFSGAAAAAAETEVREFYQYLADWEKEHLEALERLYNGVRQDFWSESHFSPF